MNKLVTATLLASLCLTACTSQKDEENEALKQEVKALTEQRDSLEAAYQSEIREKTQLKDEQADMATENKKDCQKLAESIRSHVNSLRSTAGFATLDKIFYSDKEKTCLYTANIIGESGNGYGLYNAYTFAVIHAVVLRGSKEEQDKIASGFLETAYSYGY